MQVFRDIVFRGSMPTGSFISAMFGREERVEFAGGRRECLNGDFRVLTFTFENES